MQSFTAPLQCTQMNRVRSLDSTSSFDITHDIKKQYAIKAIRKNNRKFKKPNGKPKRPLSAYNIFFKREREKLVKAKQKVGFANMAKLISVKWKDVNTEGRKEFVAAADIEQKKYRAALKEWKVSHNAEMELQMRNAQQQPYQRLHQFAGASPLLAQTDPLILQHLMIEQQLIEQHNMMQAQQMQNAAHGRRMSMPNMGTCASTTAPSFSNESLQMLQQQHQHQHQHQQQYQRHQQQYQQPQEITERRFSMPMQTFSVPQPKSIPSDTFEIALQDPFTADLRTQLRDSSDESSLDEETADILINMPILDDLEEQVLQQLPKMSSSVVAITPRRSSMPMLCKKKLEDWTTSLAPPVGAKSSRRLSMPQISDEMKDMQDILDLLDDDTPAFCSSTTSAA